MTSPETTGPTSAVQATGHRSATPAIVLALVEAEFNGLVNCPVAEEGWGPTDPVAVASDLAAVVLVPIDPVEEVSVRTALVAEASVRIALVMGAWVPIGRAVASVLIVLAEATGPSSEEGRQVAPVGQAVETPSSVVGTTSTLATTLAAATSAAAMLVTVSETTLATATGEMATGATGIGETGIGG